MNKALCTLAMLLGLTWPGALAQNPCNNPPNCIVNGDLQTYGGQCNNDMGADGNNALDPRAIPGWFVSRGSPSLGAGLPGNPGCGVWMWSHTRPISGERMFTCYNFQAGRSYRVCLNVQNTTLQGGGDLVIEAANGLQIGTHTPIASQIIATPFYDTNWTRLNIDFVATANFSQMAIYPRWYVTPGSWNNWMQYAFNVDNIQVSMLPTIALSQDTITHCDSALFTLSNMPPGATVNWVPTTGLSFLPNGQVQAKPCRTTKYDIHITNTSCPGCGDVVVSHTIVVQGDSIDNQTPNIICGDSIRMYHVNFVPSCAPNSLSWVGPGGSVLSTGPQLIIPSATAFDAGTYMLISSYPNGCVDTFFTSVDIVGCCQSTTSFSIMGGCNPLRFVDQTAGTNGGTVVSRYWEFGDGTTSTAPNPVRIYQMMGTMTVCLSTIYRIGNETCCDKVCQDVDVCDYGQCQPLAAFEVSNQNAVTHSAQFSDFSVGAGAPCGYFWDFGHPPTPLSNTSTLKNPAHTFPGPGTYHVCLTVTYCSGATPPCSDTWCEDVVIP